VSYKHPRDACLTGVSLCALIAALTIAAPVHAATRLPSKAVRVVTHINPDATLGCDPDLPSYGTTGTMVWYGDRPRIWLNATAWLGLLLYATAPSQRQRVALEHGWRSANTDRLIAIGVWTAAVIAERTAGAWDDSNARVNARLDVWGLLTPAQRGWAAKL
jgi:hypothetical protein